VVPLLDPRSKRIWDKEKNPNQPITGVSSPTSPHPNQSNPKRKKRGQVNKGKTKTRPELKKRKRRVQIEREKQMRFDKAREVIKKEKERGKNQTNERIMTGVRRH
jgi:hypothetical protein